MKAWLIIICLSYTQQLPNNSCLPIEIKSQPKTLKDYCLEIAIRLDKIGYLSVSPEKFSEFIYIVSYCESGHKLNATDGISVGLWQITAENRKRLKLKPPTDLENQADNYFKYLKAVGKKRIRSIKNSVDLHCYNFSLRDKDGVLSKVTNPGLDALDLNRDSVITKEDLKLFQNKRLNERQ